MHDLDRTTLELAHDELEFGEYEGEGEFGFEGELEGESPFNEAEAMELASELLSVTSEAELNYFLGDLISKGIGAVKGVINSPVGQAIGSVLKPLAKAALPIAGSALGGLVGGPAGAALGGSLASKAGSLFGLELEGLSQEDREFETAKQFAHLAGATASHAAKAAAEHPHASPEAIARHAVTKAAQTYAPALLTKPLNGAHPAAQAAAHAAMHAAANNGAHNGARPAQNGTSAVGASNLRRIGAAVAAGAASAAPHAQPFAGQAAAAHPFAAHLGGAALAGGNGTSGAGVAPHLRAVGGAPGSQLAPDAIEGQPGHPGQAHHGHHGKHLQNGRWYRRGNRIVLVGV